MNLFSRIFAASPAPAAAVRTDLAANVLSATGMSRRLLASMLRERGLFGRDSDLAPVEQAIVQSRLGPIPGLRDRLAPAVTDGRLVALRGFTDGLVRAGCAAGPEAQAQLMAAGYSAAAVSEVLHVVRMVRQVFGLQSPAQTDARREDRAAAPEEFARAA